jgi:hypothetical protein
MLQLAKLSIVFELDIDDDVNDNEGCVNALTTYIDSESRWPSCFDDVKDYLETLRPASLQLVAFKHASDLVEKTTDADQKAMKKLLALKLQYFVLSCPQFYTAVAGESPTSKCFQCEAETPCRPCPSCIAKIRTEAVSLYGELSAKGSATSSVQSEVAILIAYCSIRLAAKEQSAVNLSYPSATARRYLVQAALILEKQISLAPQDAVAALILAQLHVLLGSGQRALENWEVLGVKRTIINSFAPLFYDRLSTISPITISSFEKSGRQIMSLLKAPFASILSQPMPKKVIDAFEACSYVSVLGASQYVHDLRSSATRAMSLAEEARTERLFGRDLKNVLQDQRYSKRIHSPSRLSTDTINSRG